MSMAHIAGWLKPIDLPGRWLIRGQIIPFRQHFLPAIGESAKCMSPDFCVLCAHDLDVTLNWILPLSRPESEVIWLLRLKQKDHAAVSWCDRQGSRLVGITADLSLLGYVDIAPIGKKKIPEARIENYIQAIGRKAYRGAIDSLRETNRPVAVPDVDVQEPAPARKRRRA